MGGVLLNLGPQAVDIDHDGVLVDDGLSPEQIVEHILGENAVDIVDKQLHHRVLLCGEGNFHPVFIKAQGAGVVGEGSGGDEAVRPRQAVAATADKGLYLRPQSDGVEGFGHIVVRPDVQAIQSIIVLLASADDDDGGPDAPLPEGLYHLKTVHPH